MIGTLYTVVNKSGASFSINDHVTDPDNFIALQSYPQFDVDIKNNEIDRQGQHGVWDFFSYYGRRTIGFSGVIIGTDETQVELLKEQMLTVLGFPLQPTVAQDGFVFLRWEDLQGNDWEVECKLANTIQWNRPMREKYRLEFNFTLKAPTPFIYSQILNSVAGTRGFYTAGGMFPLPMPAFLGFTGNNLLDVTNTGAIDAHTIIRIYGEVGHVMNNPRIRNVTTGKNFFLTTTLANETKWIEIDSEKGTVINQDGTDISGSISGVSELITLTTGVNELMYETDEDPAIVLYSPTASFTVAFRNSKI